MPVRAPRICKCGKVVPSGVTCPCVARDNRDRKARHDAKRPPASARGYDKEWAKRAKEYLARPGNDLCQCGAPAVLVRHVNSIKSRPDLRMAESNWRPGCQRCNAIDAADERRTERNRT